MTIIVTPATDERTFKDLQDEVVAHGFDDTKYRARVKVWLNEGLRRVVRRIRTGQHDTTQELLTVAGEAEYELEGDNLRITGLFDDVQRAQVEAVDQVVLDTSPTSSGRPSAYALDGTLIRLSPTPDTEYAFTLRYRSNAERMSEDDDVPQMPGDYVDLIEAWALHKAFAAEDDFEASAFWKNEFETELPRARSDLQRRQSDRRRRVPGMFAGSSSPSFGRPAR